MITIRKSVLYAALVMFVLSFATICEAKGAPISVKYTGTGYNTTVDNLDDGYPVNLSISDAMGSFGASQVDISAEFVPVDIDCDEAYTAEFILLFSASVITFQNHSQLFGVSNDGWMCVSLTSGHYYGLANGTYYGGTGNFEGATGQWTSEFSGFNLEPPTLAPIGFRSITGTMEGHVNLPKVK